LVGLARLEMGDEVAGVALRVGVLGLVLLAEEHRQRDGCERRDDEADDEQLHEREALVAADVLGQWHSPNRRWQRASLSPPAAIGQTR
jgi:hypothetical protein